MNARQMALTRAIALILALMLTAGFAHAVDWDSLTPAEREVLMPFAEEWPTLTEAHREKLRAGARLWTSMTPQQQRLAHRRFSDWQSYSPEQRQRIIDRFQAFRNLPPEQQRLLRRTYQRFKALPEARQRELRRQFESMSADERVAFLRGLAVGQAADRATDRLRPLANMSPAQERWFRQVAAELSPAARRRLQVMLATGQQSDWNRIERRLADMNRRQREDWLTGSDGARD